MSQGTPWDYRSAAEYIANIARRHTLDENLGDTTERFETILYWATQTREGHNWGHPTGPPEEDESRG